MAILDDARASLERVQQFDAESLAREADLGVRFNFREAVLPANRLVRLFQQLTTTSLDDFPDNQLTIIRDQANATYSRFDEILKFDPAKIENPSPTRNSLIQQLNNTYPNVFNHIFQHISYGVGRAVDFRRMEHDARASIQSVKDNADKTAKELEKTKEEANAILADVRKIAAEHGVTQQAIYFKEEADSHDKDADEWRDRTVKLAWFLGFYSLASLWFTKIPGLTPDSTYQSWQLGTSKVLIFLVIAYVLLLAARNFMAHRHNAVVNRHRQNALMTFQALVDAAKNPDAKDVVLSHAASCIYAPQETGYSKVSGGGLNTSIVEMLPKALPRSGG